MANVSPPEIVSLRGQEAHRGCAERRAPLSSVRFAQPQYEGGATLLLRFEPRNKDGGAEFFDWTRAYLPTHRGARSPRVPIPPARGFFGG
jgi:hypothetical protein